MAEVATGGNDGGKGKSHQKKMEIRVDFTPMVDMNMLLITFFMLCTTMIKSQTLEIALPSNEKVENTADMNQASADDAVTIIIDAKRKVGSMDVDTVNGRVVTEVYYYFGKPCGKDAINTMADVENSNNLQKTEFSANEAGSNLPQGIRKVIRARNEAVLKELAPLREKFEKEQISQAEYDSLARSIRQKERPNKPVIVIKCTPQAAYGSLVQALDEMQINSISKYQIDNMTKVDSLMLLDYQNRHHK